MNTLDRDNLILAWQAAQHTAKVAAARELELRRQLVSVLFPNATDTAEGTENFELGNGYKVKAVFKVNRKIEHARVPEVVSRLKSQHGNPLAKESAGTLFKPKFELSITALRKIENSPEILAIVNDVITVTPATPQVEMIEPKGT